MDYSFCVRWAAALLVIAATALLLLTGGATCIKVGYERGLAAKIRTPWHHWKRNEEAETRM